MKIAAEELEKHGYRLIGKLEFAELLPFLTPYFRKGNVAMLGFAFSNFLCVLATVFFVALQVKSHSLEIGSAAGYYFLGLILAYALVPLHEYLHGLAYKAVGAKEISYDVNFRKLIFLTVAHKFVAGKKEFILVALTPFAVISALLLLLFPLVSLNGQVAILGALFMHTTCCIGDFALVSYFVANKDKQIVTYDNHELKASFFYELAKP